MDAHFLDYYNRELAYLREMGSEFAAAFPNVAGRLGMQGAMVADPYVERLLEGFAFLAARIHTKIDAEFPRFSQRLLEVVYPHYLAPTPAMAIAQIDSPDTGDRSIGRLPRGTHMTSSPVADGDTPCTFTTAHDLELWPLDILDARADLPGHQLPLDALKGRPTVKGVLRIRLRFSYPEAVNGPLPERLCFHIGAGEPDAGHLYETVLGHGIAAVLSDMGGRHAHLLAAPDTLRSEGFDAAQAMLPTDARVFQGYRLLHEYFAFPARYLFFSIGGVGPALAQMAADAAITTFELSILLDCDPAAVAPLVNTRALQLNCVPIVNLFPSAGKRLAIQPGALEHHIVPDRTRPLDYEVYRIFGIDGFDRDNHAVRTFAPFYQHAGLSSRAAQAFFSLRREPRRLSEIGARDGGRSGYRGSEVFVSLVDTTQAPWSEHIQQLALDMLLTNRDLPLFLPTGASLHVDTRLPLRGVKILHARARRWPNAK